MPGLRVLAFISGGLLATIVLLVMVGNALIDSGAIRNPLQYETPAKIVFFTLFVAFGFSLIPLMVRLVLGGLQLIGTGLNVQPFAAFIAHPTWFVVPIWILMGLGLAVGLPAAVRQGFFASEAASQKATPDPAAAAIAKMPTQGTLVAAPGMTVDAMVAESTLPIQRGSKSALFSGAQFGGAAIFDYRVAGSATRFARCRYYYITISARDTARIATINIGISPERISGDALAASNRLLAARFVADGWHARKRGTWTRGAVAMDLRARRLDDPVAGEGPNSGDWIAYVELYEAKPESR
jgi:hypothetical protein